MIKYTLTRESVVVITQDGETHTVQRDAANYKLLVEALIDEDYDVVPSLLTIAKTIEFWADGEFTVTNGTVFYKGDALPDVLNRRIIAMAAASEDPSFMFRFWERLQRNPSWRSVQQLFGFLEHQGIPILPDGKFLAYKGVTHDFKDCHTGKVDNHPGRTNRMARNKISDDPSQSCHFGFHVGALGYASAFGGEGAQVVICEVDPEHVVCIPNDHSHQKMRVCEYSVIGLYGGRLPNTVMDEEPVVTSVTTEFPVRGTQWDDFNYMDTLQLMSQLISPLRKYARHSLLMIGASKMPGGKRTLVAAINKIRPDPMTKASDAPVE